MHMVGHDHIAHKQESILSPNSGELLDEHIPCPRCSEQGQPPVATEGHKMKLTLPVVPLQSRRHSTPKSPPSNNRGWGTLATQHPMKCSSGILSSHGAVKRKEKPAPGPPVLDAGRG